MKKSLLLVLFCCSMLAGCWNSSTTTTTLEIDSYLLKYQGETSLKEQRWYINTEALAVYEEEDQGGYKDSLIVVKKFDQGKGVASFSKEAIDTLTVQGLEVEDVSQEIFRLPKQEKERFACIYSYKISSGFIPEVPQLYMTQLFVEEENSIVIFSHSTDTSSEQDSIIQSFKTISPLS